MKAQKAGYLIALLFLLISAVLIGTGHQNEAGWALMLFFLSLALTFRLHPKLKSFTFTTMIFAAAALAMFYPHYFMDWDGFKPSKLIIPLLMVIMFGMGCELSLRTSQLW